MKKIFTLIFMVLVTVVSNAQFVQQVTEINYYGFNGLNPSNMTIFDGKLFFFGTDDPQYVDKLIYTPDGSADKITIVKQIDTIKQWPTLRNLTALSNMLIFDNSKQLWKSDGTSNGTVQIANVSVGSPEYAVLNDKVYFAGDNSNSNPINDQLWQSDGTANGTTLVKTINASGPAGIYNLFSSGGKIYFGANDGINMTQLWVSDGTTAGTFMLKKLNPTDGSYPNFFVSYNGKVYFAAEDGVNGTQLWATDGTTDGTVKITNINAGGFGLQPSTFTIYNSKLYFCGIDSSYFYQLWSTDGTTEGTVKVKTDYTYRNGGEGFLPTSMAVHKDKLYMAGYDSLSATIQLWASDGTTAGTTKVTSFRLGLYPERLFSFQNRLIMTGYDTISDQVQLFASDGTAAGTVCPTPPDTWGQYPFYPWEAWVPFNDALYYKGAYAYFADYQLCRYTEFPAGIDQLNGESVSVYPNPTNGKFNVELPENSNKADIEIHDLTGALIRHQKAMDGSNTIDISNCSPGLYILRVTENSMTIASQKIIKSR
jgi:ELWxxDGT repeat protein